ncbi:YceI family protein [Dyella silvatica]|uniref:YceI family protein n=1 Tax=Dyella silvatica TaxID=2992128 RepID=UPI00225C22E1|nr:YceI family protein [Dyella silvatica]
MLLKRLTSQLLLLAVSATLPLAAARAAEASYRYDTVHSQIVFSIDHNGYSRPFGRLHIAKGWLRFDPDDWSKAATELDIDLASLDMGDEAWNKAVGKPDFLDSGHTAYAHFVSTSVERKDDQHGLLHGQLSLRGVTRPLSLSFTLNRLAKTIYGLHTVAGFSATAMLDRTDFGITANQGSIGRSVSVWLELEAIRDDAVQTDSTNKEQP